MAWIYRLQRNPPRKVAPFFFTLFYNQDFYQFLLTLQYYAVNLLVRLYLAVTFFYTFDLHSFVDYIRTFSIINFLSLYLQYCTMLVEFSSFPWLTKVFVNTERSFFLFLGIISWSHRLTTDGSKLPRIQLFFARAGGDPRAFYEISRANSYGWIRCGPHELVKRKDGSYVAGRGVKKLARELSF